MSRTDKRAGRVSYKAPKKDDIDYPHGTTINFMKAIFGADWDDEIAPAIAMIVLLSDSGETDKKAIKVLEDTRRKLLQMVKDYASELIEKGDADAFARLARLGGMINRRSVKQAVDPEAAEIIMTYMITRLQLGKEPSLTKSAPSGKDLAIAIDERRKTLGLDPSPKTPDAIRERALRLGLKLKGKRTKNK